MHLSCLDDHPRAVLAAICAVCLGLLGFGLYLQHSVGLEPCPMCIVQRYALVLVALIAGICAVCTGARARTIGWISLIVMAVLGAFVAARQSWLQWFPPEIASCGRDFYGMIETFPLQRAIPMIFKGSGDCAAIDWTFLGGSIANWSFLCFVGIAGLAALMLMRQQRGQAVPQ